MQKAYITIRKSKRSREKNLIYEIQIFKVREEFLPEFEMVSFVLSEPKGAKIKRVIFPSSFLVADMQLYKSLCPSVRRSVGWSVNEHESKSVKTRISAPAHLCATGMALFLRKMKTNSVTPKQKGRTHGFLSCLWVGRGHI